MTTWIDIHKILSNRLQELVSIHKVDGVGLHLIELFLKKQSLYETEFSWLYKSYDIVQERLSNNDWDTEPHIDPLQIFVSINNRSSKKENRIRRINALLNVLDVGKSFEDIDFDGCPTPVSVQAIRLKSDKDAILLWKYFESLLKEQRVTQKDFSFTLSAFGVEATLLSIFSFWVQPERYIPLDKWTINYLINGSRNLSLEDSLKRSERLFFILNEEPSNFSQNISVPELVKTAYVWQDSANQDTLKGTFKLLGFRTLKSNPKLFKILKEKESYFFDSNLRVFDGVLRYKYDRYNLYDLSFFENDLETSTGFNNLSVNINAIVGKNGSGKSTLLDLFYMLMYNLSLQEGLIDYDRYGRKLHEIADLNFEIYFEFDSIFKLTYLDKKRSKNRVALYKGNVGHDGVVVFSERKENISKYIDMFYTLGINYSLYSLNSLDYVGVSDKDFDWLSALTHKNDSYQTPIVITPLRDNGNIDVNKEKHLTKQRLLINLLRLHDYDIIKNGEKSEQFRSFRDIGNEKTFTHVLITGESKSITKFRKNFNLSVKERKTKQNVLNAEYNNAELYRKREIIKEYIELLPKDRVDKIFKRISNHYGFDEDVDPAYELYLISKVYKICWYYSSYHAFWPKFKSILEGGDDVVFKPILSQIDRDNSHVTDKFKQVIAFLKIPNLKSIYERNVPIKLDDIYHEISAILTQNLSSLGFDTKRFKKVKFVDRHLMIPPLFSYDYIYNDNINANDLSSGEQQQLASISNILYHIQNIESKFENNIKSNKTQEIKFRAVNIVLDEIELYFHPDYQREYLSKLVGFLSRLPINANIFGSINILFSTHSPFILSDIPSQKILKISNGSPAAENNLINSFAANIHDLLKDEFFLEGGSMGEFAKQYVNLLISELSWLLNNNNSLKVKLEKTTYQLIKDRILIIGEPLIRNSLLEMLKELKEKDSVDHSTPSYDTLLAFYKKHNN
ncbi:AAA family ATPase [Sphingobacterium corticibacterium]|uniref:ATP-binding cassette domain-containing protein n=1 Tax=Sphingobacterium corticibacterium TaxID=2484746 RepID=A0A4Q6XNH3_9SPHI|nr:AAA family ATPase [Sphingobacterium corticibacterium]RZF61461.1 ATP-binding cassette domain-containing protein [Sphingobacterium corticibacterium]